jgi:hypothetical protein
MEITDIHALTALYCSLIFGVTLKLLWAWNVEFSFIGSLSEPANTKIFQPLSFIKEDNYLNGNIILLRIVRYIRTKKYNQDDNEDPISSLLQN